MDDSSAKTIENTSETTPVSTRPKIIGVANTDIDTSTSTIESPGTKVIGEPTDTKKTALTVLLLIVILAAFGVIGYVLYTRNQEASEVKQGIDDRQQSQISQPEDEEPTKDEPKPSTNGQITSVPERLVVGNPSSSTVHKSGEKVKLTGQMKGFFEATMNARLITDNGSELLDVVVTANEDQYEKFGAYEKEVTIPTIPNGVTGGKWEFYEVSAKDGEEKVLLTISVKFA